ncbi:MAG: sigma-70 family RNA polymerase sigma factor [Isosphaeraceae bacterium]
MKSARSAQGPTGGLIREVQRLFSSGAAGLMSDAELLDQVVSRRDEASEAAFEELVTRHGPMVLRVCRGILLNAHDAEDAFQAVFLVLANRARSIRRSGSVASWLFGVARRVAIRGKQTAARRRALDRLAAERTSETQLPIEEEHDWSILHDEINRLPGSLRAPIVLCYLEGLTYAAAARQLGLSEKAIRGRLARARKRLHQRLSRRGVTVPAGLLAAGAAGHAQAAIPIPLVHSTVRIALGFVAGNAAAALARGVLNAMLLNQLKAATVVLCLGVGGGYSTWQAVTTLGGGQGQKATAPVVAKKPRPIQKPTTDRYGDPLPPGAVMRLGTVRFRQAQGIRHIVYSPDGRLVVTDSGQYRFVVRDARDGKTLRQVDLGVEILEDLVFSPDGTILATGEANPRGPQIRLWRVGDGALLWQFKPQKNAYATIPAAFSPDGKVLAVIGDRSPLTFLDTATGEELGSLRKKLSSDQGIALITDSFSMDRPLTFSPDGRTLAATGSSQTLHFWDLKTGKDRLATPEAHLGEVTALACLPDGKTLVSGSRDRTARLWDLETGRPMRMFRQENWVDSLAVSADGSVLASPRPGERSTCGISRPACGSPPGPSAKTSRLIRDSGVVTQQISCNFMWC